jgi:Cys-rich four helix bundle protein (predicted Tat secretion target)
MFSKATDVKSENKAINRREVLAGTGAVGVGLLVSAALPGAANANSHNHGDHMMHTANSTSQAPAMNQMPAMNRMPANLQLMQSAQNCIMSANICVNHCISLISRGDTSLKDCLRTASEMLPSCNNLGQLASMNARRLKEYVEFCIVVCNDCEIECRKHQSHHWQCKQCAEACAECIKQCKMFLAA